MLKKTFEIQSEKPRTHLLHLEIGRSHLLLNSFDAAGAPAAQLEFYNFHPDDSWDSLWTAVLQQSHIIGDAVQPEDFSRVRVSWENDWVQAVPTEFYQPGLEGAYQQFNKSNLRPDHHLLAAVAGQYTFPFAVPETTFRAIETLFPAAVHTHKYAGIVSQLSSFAAAYPLQVLLIFYQEHFIICAFHGAKLQLINTHHFDNGTAVIYHLLSAVRHAGAELDQTCVHLSGFIDGDSALYREIYKFVPVIDVDHAPSAPFLSQTDLYPSHFFVPFYKYV